MIRWFGGEGGGDAIGTTKGVEEMLRNISRSEGDSIDRREEVGECVLGNAMACKSGALNSAACSGVDDDDDEDCAS